MWIDITLVLLLIYGAFRGWQQGIIISVFKLLAWLFGVLGALKLSSVAAYFLQDQMGIHSKYLPIISFILVFVIIALVIFLIGKSLEKIIEIAHLGFINRMGGAALRIIIFAFIFSAFLWLMNQAGTITPEMKAQSKTYNLISPFAEWTINRFAIYLPAIKSVLDDLKSFFEKLSVA